MATRKTTKPAAKISNGSASTPRTDDVDKTVREQADMVAASAEQYAAMMDAKNRFIMTTVNLAWRLALAVLVPIIIGVWIDNRFHTSPSYTLTAVFLGMAAAAAIVWNTVKGINNEQAKHEPAKKVNKETHA